MAERTSCRWQWNMLLGWHLQTLIFFGTLMEASSGVQLDIQQAYAVMSNDILKVNVSIPESFVTGISYQGLHNLLNTDNSYDNRGFWSVVWNNPEIENNMDKLEGKNFQVIAQSENQVEVSFTRTWNGSSTQLPLNVDRSFSNIHRPFIITYSLLRGRFKADSDIQKYDTKRNIMEAKLEFLQEAEMIMKEDYEKSPPSESDRELSSGSESGKEEDDDDRVIKELKKIQKQNFLTHCLVSAMIVLTVTWQLSEVSLILKLKDGLNHPFRSLGDFITGIFNGRDKPLLSFTEDQNSADGKQRQGLDASSLPIKIPDLPHLDFITEEK